MSLEQKKPMQLDHVRTRTDFEKMQRDRVQHLLGPTRRQHDVVQLANPFAAQRLEDRGEQAGLAAEMMIQRLFRDARLARDALELVSLIAHGEEVALRNFEQARHAFIGVAPRWPSPRCDAAGKLLS